MHGVVRWRIVDLCQWIFEEFRVVVAKQTLSRELRAMGYRKLSARPRHHEQAEGAIENFLKSFPARLDEIGREKGVEPAAIRGPHRPREQDHPARWSLPSAARVQARRRTNEPPRLISSARSLPQARKGCSPHHAQMQHGGHEPAPGRNRRSDRAGRTRRRFSSIRPAGICRAGSSMPPNITLIPVLPAKCPENSIRRKTSGSSCATTGSQTESSNPTTMSSTIAARLGTTSSINPGGSCPSAFAIGPMGPDQRSLGITDFAKQMGMRIVLLFDDAAHVGREKPLEVFFDLFRTISSNITSCKASIYPGVTKFGARFDVFNDSTVIDISRSDVLVAPDFFPEVIRARYPHLAQRSTFSDRLSPDQFAQLLGRAVVGNLRGLILACNRFEGQERIGIPEVTNTNTSLIITHRPIRAVRWIRSARLIDELVPSVATVVDDVVEGFEDLVREPVVVRMNCQTFSCGFSSGHFAGNGMSVMLGRNASGAGEEMPAMAPSPTRARGGARRDLGGDFGQVHVHGFGVVHRGKTRAAPLPSLGQ